MGREVWIQAVPLICSAALGESCRICKSRCLKGGMVNKISTGIAKSTRVPAPRPLSNSSGTLLDQPASASRLRWDAVSTQEGLSIDLLASPLPPRQGNAGWAQLAPCISRDLRFGSSWYRGDCSSPESQLAQAAAEQHYYIRVNKLG